MWFWGITLSEDSVVFSQELFLQPADGEPRHKVHPQSPEAQYQQNRRATMLQISTSLRRGWEMSPRISVINSVSDQMWNVLAASPLCSLPPRLWCWITARMTLWCHRDVDLWPFGYKMASHLHFIEGDIGDIEIMLWSVDEFLRYGWNTYSVWSQWPLTFDPGDESEYFCQFSSRGVPAIWRSWWEWVACWHKQKITSKNENSAFLSEGSINSSF